MLRTPLQRAARLAARDVSLVNRRCLQTSHTGAVSVYQNRWNNLGMGTSLLLLRSAQRTSLALGATANLTPDMSVPDLHLLPTLSG